MLKKIITWSAHNRLLVIFLVFLTGIMAFYALRQIPIDAIPDLSDTQVIIYSRWERSPQIMEDQVTYPIVSALLGAPKVKAIRGFSDFGFSFVYVIFEDGTDIYWARSRITEYLSKITAALPEGVQTEIGPDATGVGWIYQYVVKDNSRKLDLQQLRSLQDYRISYALKSVPGVAEVASIGGFRKEYQVMVHPNQLLASGISLSTVLEKIRSSNQETGARVLEFSGAEYMLRTNGYVKTIADLESIPLRSNPEGAPVLLSQVARVTTGPEMRRGIADWGGDGDAVSGIIVMRHGENALKVSDAVKQKIAELSRSLPAGVQIVPAYDRSEMIRHAVDNLKTKLVEEIIVVSLIILLFLWHFPSAMIPILTIPVSVLLAFIPLYLGNINANLMSLAGIAISIGVLVDGAIVEVENAYKKIQEWQAKGSPGSFHAIRLEALLEVGPSVFFSLAIIAVAFLPVFTLVDQEGRLFRPLALSKNLAMIIAAFLAITLDPAMRMLFSRIRPFTGKSLFLNRIGNSLFIGRYHAEEKHPISRILFRYYTPVCRFVLSVPKKIVLTAALLVAGSVPVYFLLGTEFMPPLYEESLLYMPNSMPGISVDQVSTVLTAMDKKLMAQPEVRSVIGKAGRAETSTDPAPFSMIETVVVLKPTSEWRKKPRFYSGWPELLQKPFRLFFSDRVNKEELIDILDREMKFPGLINAWTMPVKNRIDMLSTGIRTPVGIKIQGESLGEIEKIAVQMEKIIRDIPGTRNVFAERTAGGFFIDIILNRNKLARFGITMLEAQEVISAGIGNAVVSQTVEGRERYNIAVRFPRDSRNSISRIRGIYLSGETGISVPLGNVAEVKMTSGPAMIRNENGFTTGYVYVDTSEADIAGYVDRVKEKIGAQLKKPDGYQILYSGQFENITRVRERMLLVLPITLILIFLLIHLNTRSTFRTLLVLSAVPFSLIGAVVFLFVLDYQLSVAVWVGMIALMGLDAETGMFMLMYLDLSLKKYTDEGRLHTEEDLKEAVIHGAVHRIRPKMMTVLSAMLGLMPIMWADGAGSDMMKRIAAPMIGGLVTSFALELVVYPAVFFLYERRKLQSAE